MSNNLQINIEQGLKIYRLKDEDGSLWFIIIFLTTSNSTYIVKVKEVRNYKVPVEVYRKEFSSKDEAVQILKKNIQDYFNLMSAEQEEIPDPIDVFNDGIEFRKIDPDCCKNCKFCNSNIVNSETLYYCSNQNNLKYHSFVSNDFSLEDAVPSISVDVLANTICNSYEPDGQTRDTKYSKTVITKEQRTYMEYDQDFIDAVNTVVDKRMDTIEQDILVKIDGDLNKALEDGVKEIVVNSLSDDEVKNPINDMIDTRIKDTNLENISGNQLNGDTNGNGIIDGDEIEDTYDNLIFNGNGED